MPKRDSAIEIVDIKFFDRKYIMSVPLSDICHEMKLNSLMLTKMNNNHSDIMYNCTFFIYYIE